MATKKASDKLSAEDVEAQSMLRLKGFIEQVDQADRMNPGTWYNLDPAFNRGWHYMRCGVKRDARAEALAANFRRMGYQDAPRGTRCVGFERDGDGGLYLMIPEKAYRVLQDRKRRIAMRIESRAASFEDQIASINEGGIRAEVQTRTATEAVKVPRGR